MEKLITFETMDNFAYVNYNVGRKPIRGITLQFFGLGGQDMWGFGTETDDGRFYGEQGILCVVPYNNPWSWMNRQAVEYTDEILDVLISHFDLPDDIPITSTGGSMGGMAALVYSAYAKRTPVACIVNCPVCDLPYHYTERRDLPRTLYSAVYYEDCSLQKALEDRSPVHLGDKMPDIDYYFFHCAGDDCVSKARHSDVFVGKYKDTRNITYYEIDGQGHCYMPPEMGEKYRNLPIEIMCK